MMSCGSCQEPDIREAPFSPNIPSDLIFCSHDSRHGWLHRMLDAPPTVDKTMVAPKWGIEYTENLTGSPKGK